MHPVRHLIVLGTLGLALTACGGGDGGGDPLQQGTWLGPHLDFLLCDGVLRSVEVQDVSCAAIQDGVPCSRDAAGRLSGTWDVNGGAVTITGENLEITGTFQGTNRFVGTYTYLDPTCCAVSGDVDTVFFSAGGNCQGGGDVVTPDTVEPDADEPDAADDDTVADADAAGPDVAGMALDLVNAARAKAGAVPLTLDSRLIEAAEAHAQYVARWFDNYDLTQMSVHDEDPDWEGFTGVKFRDRVEHFGYPFTSGWEIIAFFNDPERAVGAWLETLYHRVPIVHPNAFQLGYGGAKVGGARVDVMDFAGTYDFDGVEPVAWPYNGMKEVSTSWSGMEEPQPYLPPQVGESDGYPSGPVVTLAFPLSHHLTASELTLTDKQGDLVPSQVLGPTLASEPPEHPFREDSHLVATFALIPYDPVASGQKFTAHFVGTVDGASFEATWSFTTR